MARIEAGCERAFLLRICALVKRLRPDVSGQATHDDLMQFFSSVIDQGRELDFTSEFELAVLCSAVMLQGRAWFLDPRHDFSVIVNRRFVPAHLRANQLLFEMEKLEGRLVDPPRQTTGPKPTPAT